MNYELEINTSVEVKEKINIELPYYYKHDLMSDYSNSIIYGKIEENMNTAIQICYDYDGDIEFILEIEKRHASDCGNYLTKDEYKSSEAEYLKAKAKMFKAVENA